MPERQIYRRHERGDQNMDNKVTMEFPGLNIGEFTINKVAFEFTLFGHSIEVRWYGMIITVGIILAFLYAYYRSKYEKIVFDDLLDITLYVVLFGVIGARTYYVLTTIKDGIYHSFYDVIAIWEGGLAIYGGIIAGAITIYVICKIKKINLYKTLDMVAPAVMIGQILGRWGNFFNGEAYGYVVSENSPLYFMRMGLLPNINSSVKMYYFHPTFFYESLWNLIGFIIINIFYKKKKFDGQVTCMYFAWYGFGRMFIEGLRTDSLYVGPFRISQIVGFTCFVVGTVLCVINLVKAHKAELAKGAYEAAYPSFKTETSAGLEEDHLSTDVNKEEEEIPVDIPDESGDNGNGEDHE